MAPLLGACGGAGAGATAVDPVPVSPPTRSAPPPPVDPWRGHFLGTVTVDHQEFYGDALITVDGLVRLYVGGPFVSGGAVPQTRLPTSEQFVGDFRVSGDQGTGHGIVIAEQCAGPGNTNPLCGADASGDLAVTLDAEGHLLGELQVSGDGTTASWSLSFVHISNYDVLPANQSALAHQYREQIAEFALDGDTVINVDDAGTIVFQSAHSGCIGSGSVVPHLLGVTNAFDVALRLESCSAPYDYLNGEYSGLATTTPSSVWDYDELLRVWLSKPGATPGHPNGAALTLLASPL